MQRAYLNLYSVSTDPNIQPHNWNVAYDPNYRPPPYSGPLSSKLRAANSNDALPLDRVREIINQEKSNHHDTRNDDDTNKNTGNVTRAQSKAEGETKMSEMMRGYMASPDPTLFLLNTLNYDTNASHLPQLISTVRTLCSM
jgi:hypothetical protein